MTQIASTTCAADGTITTFTLDGESLMPLATSQIGKGVSAMAVEHVGSRAYVSVKEPAGVATVELDRATGGWTQTSHRALPSYPSHLSITGDGRFLIAAHYGGNCGMLLPLTDGQVGEPTAVVERQRMHSAVEIDGYCYFVSLAEDLIACFRITDDGRLTPLEIPTVAAPRGSGARHVVASANGRNLYVVTEFTGEVLRYARDPHTGVLALQQRVVAHATDRGLKPSVIDQDPIQNHYVWGADLHLAGPEGRWLVVSERTESTLAVLPVADDGTLAEPVSLAETEERPRGFCVTPDENHVLCPGEKSSQVSLFRLEDDGQLVRVAQAPNGMGANWARVV